jgi:hypothetical protein
MLNPLNLEFRDAIIKQVVKVVRGDNFNTILGRSATKGGKMLVELEFRLVNSFKRREFTQTLQQFKHISDNIQRMYADYDETYTLDVRIDADQERSTDRLTINGLENIKRYCRTGTLKGIDADNLVYIEKLPTRNLEQNLEQYNLRIGLSTEETLTDRTAFDQQLVSPVNKYYRYKHRYSFRGHEKLRFDLTVVKSGRGPSLMECYSDPPKPMHLFKSPEKYEVEIEFINLPANTEIQKYIDPRTSLLVYNCLKWSQRSFAVMKSGPDGEPFEELIVRDEYKQLTFPGKHSTKDQNRSFFIGMNVYPLKISDIETIKSSYSVTDKADGARYLLFISGSKSFAGVMYLITNQLEIRHTGLKIDDQLLWGSVFDGELVMTGPDSHQYLIFDCLFLNGKDVRNKPLVSFKKGPKITIDSENCRYGLIAINAPKLAATKPIANDVNIMIKYKEYEFCIENGPNIFQLAERVLGKPHIYKQDGLIFTPYEDPYPVAVLGKNVKWPNLFKWKPLSQLSIDFLVDFTRQIPVVDTLTGNKYIEAELKVQQMKPTGVEVNSFMPAVQVPRYRETPSQDYDSNFNVIRLPVDDSGMPRARDKNFIYNHSIVEFIYQDDAPRWSKWVPLRVRSDKIMSNAQIVVDSTWALIIDPVTELMITGKAKIQPEKATDQYYTDVAEGKSLLVKPMKEYHNAIKSFLFKQTTTHIRQQAGTKPIDCLDIACGQGGDLHKWQFTKLNFVLGIDNDYNNLYTPGRGAQARRDKQVMQNESRHVPTYPADLYLVWGDSRNFLNDGAAGSNDGNRALLKSILSRRGPSSFDIVSCQFALHYFTETEDILSHVLYNVAYNLKMGGYFIGTTLDGEIVHQQLKSRKSISGQVDKEVIWKIDKKYPDKESFGETGQKITAFNISIGQAFDEYLVNFEYLAKLAASFGLIPINKDEIPGLQGRQSFGEIREEILKMSHDKSIQLIKKMSSDEKTYSDMNKYFIFKKIKHPSKNIELEKTTIPETGKLSVTVEDDDSSPDEAAASSSAPAKPPKKTVKKDDDVPVKPPKKVADDDDDDDDDVPVKPPKKVADDDDDDDDDKPPKKTPVSAKPSKAKKSDDDDDDDDVPAKPSKKVAKKDDDDKPPKKATISAKPPKAKKSDDVPVKPPKKVAKKDDDDAKPPKKTPVSEKPSKAKKSDDDDDDDVPVKPPKKDDDTDKPKKKIVVTKKK